MKLIIHSTKPEWWFWAITLVFIIAALAGWSDGVALGGGSLPAYGAELPQDHWPSGSMGLGRDTRPNEVRRNFSTGESGVR